MIENTYKSLLIPEVLHTKLKVRASKERLKLNELVNIALQHYLIGVDYKQNETPKL